MKTVRTCASVISFAVILSLVVGCNPTPTVTVIDPPNGPETGGTEVTVTGTNFQKGAEVDFGGTKATPTDVTPTSITVATPAGAAGTVNVTVVNPKGRVSQSSVQFTYDDTQPPTVSSTDPAMDATVEGTEVKAVTVTFSEDVSAATIDLTSEPLPENKRGKPGTVTGETTASGAIATLTLANALAGGYKYTATITGTDVAGNAGEPQPVSFTIPAPAAPARR